MSAQVCIEHGPFGITSNVISPGPIAGTEGMARLASRADNRASSSAAKRIPSGRWGTVKEIADATIYLFSDAGNYVNGEILVGKFTQSVMIQWSLIHAVDGGAWHRSGSSNPGSDWEYPDFILSGAEVQGVKGGRKQKL